MGSQRVKHDWATEKQQQCRRHEFDPWVREIHCRRKCQPTPVFLPGKSYWQRSLVGYSPRGCKELDTTEQLHFHMLEKMMLKILQARLQQYVNCELPDVQADFRKQRGTRDQIANICWIIEKAREFQRNMYFCFTDHTKALTVWITINCGKFWKRGAYQTT